MFKEEIRSQNWSGDNGDLEGMLGLQSAKREGYSLGTKTRDRSAIGGPQGRDLGGELALPFRRWKNGDISSTVDEERALGEVIDDGERA